MVGQSINNDSRPISHPANRDVEFLHLKENALDQISEGVLITDENQTILYTNKGFERLTGYSASEVLGKNCRILQGAGTDPATLEVLRKNLRSGQHFNGEILNYRKNGETFWNALSINPIYDQSGKLIRFIGTQRDITRQKKQETEAHRDLETHSQIVKILQEIASDSLDLDSTLKIVVARARELSHADGAVMALLEGEDLVNHVPCGILEEQTGSHFRAEGSFSGLSAQQGRVLLCDDAETDTRVDQAACRKLGVRSLLIAPVRLREQVIGVLKVVSQKAGAFTERDANNLQILVESLGAIIQKHQGTEKLRESESQYRLLFQLNPQPMWVYDTGTLRFLAVNPAAIDHYGYSEEEFLQLTLRDIRPQEYVPIMENFLSTLAHDQKQSAIWTHRKKDGTLIEVEVLSNGIQFEDRPARLALAHDITDKLKAERELQKSVRAQTMLSTSNEILVRMDDEQALIRNICQIAVDIGGYRMAWVGYAQDDEKKNVLPMAFAGEEKGFLSQVFVTWDEASPHGCGPAGLSIRKGEPCYCKDIEKAENFAPWREPANACGFRSLIALPLRDGSRAFGLLCLYSSEIQEWNDDEVKLLQELADDLAFGITSIRTRIERQRIQSAVLKVATGISSAGGTEFFKQLVLNLTDSVGAHAGYVARILKNNPHRARTTAAVVEGRITENFEYDLPGTPCEFTRDNALCVISRDLQQQFPSDAALRELNAQAYVGTQLSDNEGNPLGMMCVLFQNPLAEPEFTGSMLKIFAVRASSELERQQSDARLREQASLLDKARDAILVRDLEEGIQYWNKSAERLYGWTAEEALGRSARELLYKETTGYDKAFREVREKGEWVGELEQINKDGKPLTVEGHWTLVRGNDGHPQSILAINTDITDKKKLEQQFLRTQRLESIGTLAGGIAHDLNNILTPIMMCVDILKMKNPEAQSARLLDTISSSASRGAGMINQVLTFARGIEGRKVQVQIDLLIHDIKKISTETFPKNIVIETVIKEKPWIVLGDPTQLHQVLLNLCVNARDAMPQGGKMTIQARNVELDQQYAAMNLEAKVGPYVVLQVEDNGTGIPPGLMDKIFDPFFTTKESGKGTGLGLSTTQSIIKGHGGFMRVYSEHGKGTLFSAYLPAQPGLESSRSPETNEPAAKGNGESILLVEDEPAILEITRQTLEASGYRVMTAKDGAEAVALYAEKQQAIDLVILDMTMPLMDGSATIQVLMKINPSVKIVATSGIATNQQLARSSGSAVQHFLQKPYTSDSLLKIVRKGLT